ncbi:MAG TPA: hypothetical protein VGR70_13575 [Stellaceae bacterium]|nr:hypothetical protein [Stellaceae bacterium]
MWNLTPDYIQQVKEELKGRRAAIEARYADELKGIATDLEEIEQLERIAYAFAVKHLPDPQPVDAVSEPAVEVAELQPVPAEPVSSDDPESEPEPEPEVMEKGSSPKGGLSRWRMRLENNAEADSA